MLGFALGVFVSNGFEWAFHKYALHGLARKKTSYWAFHWHEHHKNVRKSGGYDPMYNEPILKTPSKAKEVLGVITGPLLAAPLLPVLPGFFVGACANSVAYYFIHKKAHLDPAWGRKWVPWHVDHHLGPDQHKNWCVTWPLFDWIMGTRVPFVGTEAEFTAPKATVVSVAA